MAHLNHTAASLRIIGDDLDPDEVSKILGCLPTAGFRKGDVVPSPSSGTEYTKKTGAWMLEAKDQTPGDLDEQVRSLLAKLPEDLNVWKKLASQFRLDLSCGFFMQETSEGMEVSAETLMRLGERSILLSLCLYAPLSDEDDRKEGLLF